MVHLAEANKQDESGDADLTATSRYQQLDLVDRHSAESLNEHCKIATGLDQSATSLANYSFYQAIVTSLPLAASDFLALFACISISTAVIERFSVVSAISLETPIVLFLALIILPTAHLAGLYPGMGLGSIVEFRQLARSLFASAVTFIGIIWLAFPGSWSLYAAAILAFTLALPCTMMARFLTQHLLKHCSWWGAPTLIVAEPQRALELYWKLASRKEHGFRPVGVLLDPEQYWDDHELLEQQGVPVFDIRNADEVALRFRATWVMASACANREQVLTLDPTLAVIPNRVLLASDQLDLGIWDQPLQVGDNNCLLVANSRPNSFQLAVKRSLDLLLTTLTVLAGFPVLLGICVLIRLSSRGPIFYGQTRIGRGGRPFTAWKFRSMLLDSDQVLETYLDANPAARQEWEEKRKLSNDPRVTTIGKILRATSLDEVPQLWNVLVGEMSLVGPRPIIDSSTYDAAYIERYPDEFDAYKTVRPGLTGLWQVRCRNSDVYDFRIYWDMFYIRNWSIWLDLYLIMRTFKTVIFREGAY